MLFQRNPLKQQTRTTSAMYQVQHQPAKESAHKKGKPFCKVCFDAGKQEQEYTSHCVKTDGVVTCTTLLSQSCRNCGQHGHTRGYCKTIVLAETELRFKAIKPEPQPKPKPTNEEKEEEINVHYNPKSNAFGALSQKQPKQLKSLQQIPAPAKPMTMAERLKNPTPRPTPTPEVKSMHKSIQIKIDMPPKSQFWWQDEVE